MKISASLLFHMLSYDNNIVVIRESEPGSSIDFPMLLSSKTQTKRSKKDKFLYIVDHMKQNDSLIRQQDALLVVGTEKPSNFLPYPCAHISDNITPEEALYKVFKIIQRLQSWDCEMKDARHQEASLEETLTLIEKTFPRPLLLVDSSYNYIVYSRNYFETVEEPKPNTTQEIMPSSVLNDLILDKEFLTADKQKGVCIYPSSKQIEKSLYINFFKKDKYMARLLSYIGKEESSIGEKELFIHIASYLKDAYFHQLDEQIPLRQNDEFHVFLRELVTRRHFPHSTDPIPIPECTSWLEKHTYQVAAIRMFNLREFELSAPYLCTQLEDTCPGTVALIIDNEIVWVINCSLLNETPVRAIEGVIKEILGNFACKAGMSIVHDQLHSIGLLYQQTLDALRLGEARDAHFWFYRFESYALDYKLRQITEEYPRDYTLHQGIKALIESDSSEGTEYISCLKNYFECSLNISQAAEKTFVHRSTFIRQLARIKQLTGMDFSESFDLEDVTHLLTSLVLHLKSIDDQ